MATTIPSAALVSVAPVFTNAERLALAGFLAGYSGLTRQAYELDPGGCAPLPGSTVTLSRKNSSSTHPPRTSTGRGWTMSPTRPAWTATSSAPCWSLPGSAGPPSMH
jgi:hypothetical protein